jgi:hypothetical protein
VKPAVAWAGFWLGFAALDFAADRRGVSLSHTTRNLFRTDTPAGAVAFSAALGAGAAILHRHIIKE